MNLGDKLIKIRKENKMSQETFAEKLNVTRQTVSNWENYKSYPDISTLIKISDLFHVSLDILLKGDLPVIKSMDKKIKNHKKLKVGIIVLFSILVIISIVLGILLYLVPEKIVGIKLSGKVDIFCSYPDDDELGLAFYEKPNITIFYNKVYKYPISIGWIPATAYRGNEEEKKYVSNRLKELGPTDGMVESVEQLIKLYRESGAECNTEEFDNLHLKDKKKN